MRENRTSGSVQGASGNGRSYCEMAKSIGGNVMSRSVEEIEKAIASLPRSELKKFRAWYEEFDSSIWDQQIEEDAKSGELDALADAAIADHKAGKSKKL